MEKEYLLETIRRLSSVYFAEVPGFCLMGNRAYPACAVVHMACQGICDVSLPVMPSLTIADTTGTVSSPGSGMGDVID